MLGKLAVWVCGALLAASLAPVVSAPAPAEEPRPAIVESPANVRVIVRLGTLDQGKRTVVKTYQLLVAAGSGGSKLLSGSRVPIPTAVPGSADTGAGGAGATPLVYQNIGFSVTAEARMAGGGKVKLVAEIEDSRLTDRGPSAPPVVETRQLSVNAILADGVPMEVTRVEADADRSGFVEIEAKILK